MRSLRAGKRPRDTGRCESDPNRAGACGGRFFWQDETDDANRRINLHEFFKQVNDSSLTTFRTQKRILSFQHYLDAFCLHPVQLGRNAAQYVLDVFKHFGTRKVPSIGGKATRFVLFDAPWDNGRGALDVVVGQHHPLAVERQQQRRDDQENRRGDSCVRHR